MVNEDELRALARKWADEAMSYVPAEYAERGLHGKYLKLDNYAAGLDDCAIELLELLDTRSPTLREAERPFAGASSGVEQIQCPGCDSWVTLYDGNKIPFHSKLGRVDSPICQQSNAIYSPRS